MNSASGSDSSSTSVYKSWAERNGFSDWALAILWIIAAFIGFQLTAGIVAVALIVMRSDTPVEPTGAAEMLIDNLDLLFIGNSAGQILFLGLATWFFCRLHTSKRDRPGFLRFRVRGNTSTMVIITTIATLALQPTIWFLSWLNAQIPVPEVFEGFQQTQMDMIEQFLRGDHVLWLTLFHVGLVPAVCEETLYRGYVMRAFEKSWGIWPAILVSGLLFGLYHVQLSNLLPLATIGIFLAYVTWTSESIYPAMVAHLVNNGGSVLVGTYYPESAFAEITPESMPPLWAVFLSLIISSFLIYSLYMQHRNTNAAAGD